ncbi:MAG: hypothetical protein NW208_10075 [Bryobacter sp.]|nr:hypothetical protein [Bryobacter sp.]
MRCLALLLGLHAWAAEPLPPELARMLDLTRMMPAELGAPLMIELTHKSKIAKEQKAALAFEAYLAATGFGVKAAPVYAARTSTDMAAWLARGESDRPNPLGAAVLAWKVYEDNRDPEWQREMEFPGKRTAKRELCSGAYVDDPLDYYEALWQAGPKLFRESWQGEVRYAVDLGRLVGVLAAKPREDRALVAIERLLAITSTDRQFAYAMEFTRLHDGMLKIAQEAGKEAGKRLFELYAGYLTRHFGQRRCVGNEVLDYRGAIAAFNKAAEESEKAWGVTVVRLEEEVGRAKSVDPDSYAEKDADFQDLVYLRLRIAGAQNNVVNFRSILREVEKFEAPGRLPVNIRLLQKNYAFRMLSVQYKGTPFEDEVMEAWLHEMALSRLQKQAPQIWRAAVENVVEWVGNNRRRQATAEFAGDGALAAYLRLVDLALGGVGLGQ